MAEDIGACKIPFYPDGVNCTHRITRVASSSPEQLFRRARGLIEKQSLVIFMFLHTHRLLSLARAHPALSCLSLTRSGTGKNDGGNQGQLAEIRSMHQVRSSESPFSLILRFGVYRLYYLLYKNYNNNNNYCTIKSRVLSILIVCIGTVCAGIGVRPHIIQILSSLLHRHRRGATRYAVAPSKTLTSNVAHLHCAFPCSCRVLHRELIATLRTHFKCCLLDVFPIFCFPGLLVARSVYTCPLSPAMG